MAVDLVAVTDLVLVTQPAAEPLLAALGQHIALALVVLAAIRLLGFLRPLCLDVHLGYCHGKFTVPITLEARGTAEDLNSGPCPQCFFPCDKARSSTAMVHAQEQERASAAGSSSSSSSSRVLRLAIEAVLEQIYVRPRAESSMKLAGGFLAALLALKYARSLKSACAIGFLAGVFAQSVYADVLRKKPRMLTSLPPPQVPTKQSKPTSTPHKKQTTSRAMTQP